MLTGDAGGWVGERQARVSYLHEVKLLSGIKRTGRFFKFTVLSSFCLGEGSLAQRGQEGGCQTGEELNEVGT